jgi:hypothetical protein
MVQMPENSYESREGIAALAKVYTEIFGDIKSLRKKGHLPKGISRPNTVKFAALEALQECANRSIPPPNELVDLIRQLFEIGDEGHRRNKIKFPIRKAARIAAETGLRGRALAREMPCRGINVSDRSVARYQRNFAPQ